MPPRTIADFLKQTAAVDSSQKTIPASTPTDFLMMNEINNVMREPSTLAKENLTLKNCTANQKRNMAVFGASTFSGFGGNANTLNQNTLGSASVFNSLVASNSYEPLHIPATKANGNTMCFGIKIILFKQVEAMSIYSIILYHFVLF